MSAIITENFRRNNAIAFITDIEAHQTISGQERGSYVGIGRSQAWPDIDGDTEDDTLYNVESPLGTAGDDRDVKNNLTTLIGITSSSTSLVIPKITAKVNRQHKTYDPYDVDCFYASIDGGAQKYPCYVLVADRVYLCLREATDPNATHNFPSGVETLTREPQGPLADGSIWIYLYTHTVTASTPIDSDQFMSVPQSPTFDVGEVIGDITTASGAMVYGFHVLDGGSGYTTPTVKYVDETGTKTTLVATVSSGAITTVKWNGALAPTSYPNDKGYVEITGGGSGARVYPMVAPDLGFGAVPYKDLPAWYAGITVDADNEIFSDGQYIPYRQVSVIRHAAFESGTSDPYQSLKCLDRLVFNPFSLSVPSTGDIVTQDQGGGVIATGIVDVYDAAGPYHLYYHQNYETGFIPFITGDPVKINGGTNSGNVTALLPSEYVTGSGEVLFTENRKKISRASGQTEEITLVIQF